MDLSHFRASEGGLQSSDLTSHQSTVHFLGTNGCAADAVIDFACFPGVPDSRPRHHLPNESIALNPASTTDFPRFNPGIILGIRLACLWIERWEGLCLGFLRPLKRPQEANKPSADDDMAARTRVSSTALSIAFGIAVSVRLSPRQAIDLLTWHSADGQSRAAIRTNQPSSNMKRHDLNDVRGPARSFKTSCLGVGWQNGRKVAA